MKAIINKKERAELRALCEAGDYLALRHMAEYTIPDLLNALDLFEKENEILKRVAEASKPVLRACDDAYSSGHPYVDEITSDLDDALTALDGLRRNGL